MNLRSYPLSLTSLYFADIPQAPYQIYSGVVHAELWGLWRGIAELPADGHPHRRYQAANHPLAVHSAAHAAIGALVITAARAASHLGAAEHRERILQWAKEGDAKLVALRPSS